ncbi:MAG: AMP-binding protein [Lachnospiraceae bacterium]|nr:AMP-binding protein [Lachnospiraceae bacterium]
MKITVTDIIKTSLEKFADYDAVIWPDKDDVIRRTYREFGEDIGRIRAGLHAIGLTAESWTGEANEEAPGPHIAIVGRSSYPWITVFYGVLTSNGVVVPIDMGLSDEDIIDELNRSDTSCAFVDPLKKTLLERLASECPKVQKVILLTDKEGDAAFEKWTEFGAGAPSYAIQDANPDAVAAIMFTSGTTGVSKGVMLTQGSIGADSANMYYHIPAGAVDFSVLPIHHAFCLTVDWVKAFEQGATVAVNDSVGHLAKNIKIFEPSVVLMVPLMVETIYKKLKSVNPLIPKKLVGSQVFGKNLRHVICGGARLDPMYVEEFKKYGINIWMGYGSTETSPVVSFNGERGIRWDSLGHPVDNTEVEIRDGEVCVRGDIVMKGYYKMPEETAKVLKDGWFYTGDLGYLDDDGYLYLTGRKKNLIILANGENISPEEIEGAFDTTPIVGEIVVVGEGTNLRALIYPDPDKTRKMKPEQVQKEVEKVIKDYNKKQPSYRRLAGFELRDEPFPKTSTRKIKRDMITTF